MRKLLQALVAIAVLASGTARGQDLTGTWQGTLAAPQRELRMMLKITKDAGGALKAVMYSIDQTPQGVAASSVTLQGTTVTISIPGLGGGYDGKLSADGNAITGTFSQGPGKLPLNLVRATGDAVWTIPEPVAALKPMPAAANPTFEVATIKPARPELQGKGITIRGRDVVTINTSLMDLIAFSYGVHPKQVEGLPAWASEDKYEITGRPDGEGLPNDRQIRSMIQKLLAERFKLALHRDKKEQSVYALTVARGGAKMTASAGDPNGLPGLGFGRPGAMIATNATMADVAGTLQAIVLDRPVIDQTGLTGRFDFRLNWTPDESQFPGIRVPAQADNTAPNLFTAIQEQIGLRLEPTRAPADVLVVDKADKPTEN